MLVPDRRSPREIGTPLPIGLSGLALAAFVISGLNLGWVPTREATEVGLILVSVPTVLQLLASVLGYVTGDASGGTAFGVLGVCWLAQGLVHISNRPGQVLNSLGLLLLAVATILFLTATAVARTRRLPGVTLTVASIHFALAGIYQLSADLVWEHATGVVGLLLSGLAAAGMLRFELVGEGA